MIKIVLGIILLGVSFNVISQDYFIVDNDTTFCSDLSYGTSGQGFLKSISYKTKAGEEVSIKGRRKVPKVTTFCIDSITRDWIPSKANKPNGYYRYIVRVVSGKLRVYSAQAGYNSTMVQGTNGAWQAVGPSGIYKYYIRMPDGKFYKINKKKHMNKYIKPYLLKCPEFKKQYKGNFEKYEEVFNETVRLYNSLCG